MKKFVVFTESTFVPTHELSISNKIIESESTNVIADIIRDWVHSIEDLQLRIVYKSLNIKKDSISDILFCSPFEDDKHRVKVIYNDCNVRIQIGTYEKKYITREV